MKKRILLIVIICSYANLNTYCSEAPNAHIGNIDKLMISQAITEKGKEELKKEINSHEFDKLIYGNKNPFCITHRCPKSSTSQLDVKIFQQKNNVEYGRLPTVNNIFNQHHTALDQCTRYSHIKDGSKDILAIAYFHNKEALLKALEVLSE
jgi:hypothetical protein